MYAGPAHSQPHHSASHDIVLQRRLQFTTNHRTPVSPVSAHLDRLSSESPPITCVSPVLDDGCHDTFALTSVENFTGESSTTPFDTSSPHLDYASIPPPRCQSTHHFTSSPHLDYASTPPPRCQSTHQFTSSPHLDYASIRPPRCQSTHHFAGHDIFLQRRLQSLLGHLSPADHALHEAVRHRTQITSHLDHVPPSRCPSPRKP